MSRKTSPVPSSPDAPSHAVPADLALFVRVAELGSFSAVARERDGVASQVSRAVDRLEALYRVRLLRRSTHGLSLTPEGSTLLLHARQVLAALYPQAPVPEAVVDSAPARSVSVALSVS